MTGSILASHLRGQFGSRTTLPPNVYSYRVLSFAVPYQQFVTCKIWGFHGGVYEECRLLGYKNPVRTSQETHYVSATEPSQLMLCKNWGFHGGVYEECLLLRYKNPVFTSPETHYVSATQSSQLMLCKIWGFHDGNYEECRLLSYKNPVRTLQETHYVSATEPSQLMLCKIWSFHGGVYEECRLLGCDTVSLDQYIRHKCLYLNVVIGVTLGTTA
jgi:hypothetical protein